MYYLTTRETPEKKEEKKEFAVIPVAPSGVAFEVSRLASGCLLVAAKLAMSLKGRSSRIGSKKSFEPSTFCKSALCRRD